MLSWKQCFGLVACLVSLLVFFSANVLYAGPMRLSYANFPPAPTFPCVQMERWVDEVEKRTNGQVRIDTYPGGSLLGAKVMMDGVIQGQADIGCLCMAYQPGRFMLTNAISLPLGLENARVASLTLWDLYEKYQPEAFEEVKVLTMFTTAPSNIMSKKPIRSLEDLKGLDLRASGGAAEILRVWGANQVGMPMSETPEALQKGVVQGLFSSLEVMKDFNYAEICRFITLTNTVVYPFAVVMNKDSWEALPQEIKDVMDDLGREQAKWTGEYMDNHVREAISWSKEKYDVEVITLTQDQYTNWNSLLDPVRNNWMKKAEKHGFAAQCIVDDIQALAKKNTLAQ
jgi:TRAP-type C4-dicarboxylate transport system substrate-binding protein